MSTSSIESLESYNLRGRIDNSISRVIAPCIILARANKLPNELLVDISEEVIYSAFKDMILKMMDLETTDLYLNAAYVDVLLRGGPAIDMNALDTLIDSVVEEKRAVQEKYLWLEQQTPAWWSQQEGTLIFTERMWDRFFAESESNFGWRAQGHYNQRDVDAHNVKVIVFRALFSIR